MTFSFKLSHLHETQVAGAPSEIDWRWMAIERHLSISNVSRKLLPVRSVTAVTHIVLTRSRWCI